MCNSSMKNIIYYFTGTGNSLQVANDVKESIGNCELKKMVEYNNEEIKCSTLGIIFPVYMWGAPTVVIDFVKKINVSKSVYIYAITTYGAIPGKALEHVEKQLEFKGLSLSSGFNINMPGNCITQYGAFPAFYQKYLLKKEPKKIAKIVSVIKNKRTQKLERSNILIDRLFNDMMYKGINELKGNDINFHTTEKCTLCGQCVKICPVNNIKINDDKVKWQHNCAGCMACIQRCPNKAIEYGNKTKNRTRYVNSYLSNSKASKL